MSKNNYKTLLKYLSASTSSRVGLYAEMPVSKILKLFPSAKVDECYKLSYCVMNICQFESNKKYYLYIMVYHDIKEEDFVENVFCQMFNLDELNIVLERCESLEILLETEAQFETHYGSIFDRAQDRAKHSSH